MAPFYLISLQIDSYKTVLKKANITRRLLHNNMSPPDNAKTNDITWFKIVKFLIVIISIYKEFQ